MFDEIPSDLLEILKCVVACNLEEYDVELLNNEKGEGFVGEIVFINLTHKLTKEKIHLILKQEQVKNGETVEKFTSLCRNELEFYDVIWPFLKKYYKNVSNKNVDFVPKYFGGSHEGRIKIVLENLRQPGYSTYDKSKPFDDDHCQIIFKTYGIYHGISMALRELDNEQYNQLVGQKSNVFAKEFEKELMINAFKERLEESKEYFDPVKEKSILDKLEICKQYELQPLCQVLNEGYANGVILHGDCWSNNLMFKYDENNKPQDLKLLDFQLLCHGSPVLDLSYCLYSAADEEILNKLNDYLEIYHHSLSDTLNEFGLDSEKIYSLKTFKEEWKKYCKYGFPLGIFLWKLKLLSRNDVPDLTEEPDKMKKTQLSENMKEVYRRRIRELIIHLHKNDFI